MKLDNCMGINTYINYRQSITILKTVTQNISQKNQVISCPQTLMYIVPMMENGLFSNWDRGKLNIS